MDCIIKALALKVHPRAMFYNSSSYICRIVDVYTCIVGRIKQNNNNKKKI